MGSTEHDDTTTEIAAQFSDSESSELDLTVPINDTIPDEDNPIHPFNDTFPIEEETQPLDDLDCGEIERTQIVDSDGEGSDRTEVLSGNECEFDDYYEKEMQLIENDAMECEKKRGSSVAEGLDALNDEHCGPDTEQGLPFESGVAPRSFMSVRAEARSIQGHSQSEELVRKDNEEIRIGDRANNGMQGREVDTNHGTLNYNGTTEGTRDEIEGRVARSTVRRLFPEDAPDNDGSMPEFDSNDYEFAGLSYIGSQVPGELSQANALNIVDMLISVNDEDSPQKTNWGSTIKLNSPPPSKAKGAQMLAQRIKHRSPVREDGIFDWDDNHEDEGGGYFFSKRKEELLGRSFHMQKKQSYTQPKNPMPLNTRKGRGTVDKIGLEEKDLKLHRKIVGLTCSDSRLMVNNLKENGKNPRVSKLRTRKNLSEILDEQPSLDTSTRQLETTGNSKGSLNICDVGIDTQMAAEAMEALGCAVPSNHNKDVAFHVTPNDSKGCTGNEIMNKAHTEKLSLRRRCYDSGGTSRRSQRLKALDTNLSIETSQKNSRDQKRKELVSDSANKGKDRKVNARKHLNTGTATDEVKTSGTRSATTDQASKVSAMNKTRINEADRFHRSSASNGNSSFSKGQMQEDYRFSTPVARRTRSSLVINPLKSSGVSCDDIGDDTVDVVKVKGKNKRQRSFGVDSSEPSNVNRKSCKLPPDVTDSVRKVGSIQKEALDCGSHEKITKMSNGKKDTHRYPQRKRTHQNMLNNINEVTNADAPYTAQGMESNGHSMTRQKKLKGDVPSTAHGIEANGKSVARQKRVKVDVITNGVELDQKRITRSSAHCNPSSLSSEKKCEENLIRQSVLELALTESAVEGIEANARLDVSLAGKIKQSGTACVTPNSSSATPINPASPVCVANDYHKSYKKSLSRSPLMRELTRLDANEVLHSPASKDSRKRKDMANVRVLFSHHLDEDIIRQQKKILVRLGASIACSFSDSTHFVTDKFVRTRNMLEAIASGKPVVTHLWLQSCGQASCFIDEKTYILRDSKKETEIGFSMPVSLVRASQSPLLESKRVYITRNVKPSKEVIASLVKAVHGQVVERLGRATTMDDKVPDDLLVLSCEEDYATCVALLEKGAMVYSSELLLNGIVIQKLEYERHRLFPDQVRRTHSAICLRKGDGDQFLRVGKRN